MEREIKFRAWDSVIKEMVYCDNKHYWAFFNSPDSIGYGLYHRNDGHRVLSGEYNPPIMQYTGLKDKNGKEIYEGDIVKCIDHPTNIESTIGEVHFEYGCFCVRYSMITLGGFREEWIEKLGNVYEHPELLANPAKV